MMRTESRLGALRNTVTLVLVAALADAAVLLLATRAGASMCAAHLAGLACATAILLLQPAQRWALLFAAVLSMPLRAVALEHVDASTRAGSVAVLAVVCASAAMLQLARAWLARRDGSSRSALSYAALLALVGASIAVRAAVLGSLDLLPEEAYYWGYAQRPALGYLDHPPMIAWLIAAGTRVFGDTELGVRVAVFATWIVAAWCVFVFAAESYGRRAGFVTTALFATLPYFFSNGVLATPDAPLTAAWAATLLFLRRALERERSVDWLAAGACLGLGMLSKYTIALLVPATLVFMLAHARTRAQLARPQPYVAAFVALAVFAPVIVWNATHDWASFRYQTVTRIASVPGFHIGALVAGVLLIMTPPGAYALARVLARRRAEPRHRFALVFSLVPLAVFTVFALRYSPKVHWTGPLWIAALPLLAHELCEASRRTARAAAVAMWSVMAVLAIVLHYLVLGLPDVGSVERMRLPRGWPELAHIVGAFAQDEFSAAEPAPLLVGMDRNFIASELAFYSASPVVGRNLFGRTALMFDTWSPPADCDGRDLVLVAFDRRTLEDPALAPRVDALGGIVTREVRIRGEAVGQVFLRAARGYRAP